MKEYRFAVLINERANPAFWVSPDSITIHEYQGVQFLTLDAHNRPEAKRRVAALMLESFNLNPSNYTVIG